MMDGTMSRSVCVDEIDGHSHRQHDPHDRSESMSRVSDSQRGAHCVTLVWPDSAVAVMRWVLHRSALPLSSPGGSTLLIILAAAPGSAVDMYSVDAEEDGTLSRRLLAGAASSDGARAHGSLNPELRFVLPVRNALLTNS